MVGLLGLSGNEFLEPFLFITPIATPFYLYALAKFYLNQDAGGSGDSADLAGAIGMSVMLIFVNFVLMTCGCTGLLIAQALLN